MRLFDRRTYEHVSLYPDAERRYHDFILKHEGLLTPAVKQLLKLNVHDEIIKRIGSVDGGRLEVQIGRYLLTFLNASCDSSFDDLPGEVWLMSELERVVNGTITLGILLGSNEFRITFTDVQIFDVLRNGYVGEAAPSAEAVRKRRRRK